MSLVQKGRWITLVALVSLGAVYVRALAFTPVERLQGPAQKIFYLHVPAALWTEAAMVLVGLAGIFYLFLKDPRLDRFAEASAEVGTVFATIVLTTGPIWGKPIWGTWWTWDARLTSTLFLFFLYVGYLLVRGAVRDPALRARYAAVLGICGMCLVPFIHLSVFLFRTLHPQPIILKPSAPSLPNSMLATWLFSLAAFTLLYVGFVTQRYALSLARAAQPGRSSAAGRPIHCARRECGIGALFEGEHLLVRHERILLAEHHLPRFAQQHPGVGIRGEALRCFLRRGHRAPPVLDGAPQPHQRRVGFRERRRDRAAEPQPQLGAFRCVALTGRRPSHGEARERGAQGAEHCRLHQSMSHTPRPPGHARVHPLAGRRIAVTRAREQAGTLVRELEALGAEVVAAPTIRMARLTDLAALRAALTRVPPYDWIVFTSQNAVQVVCDRLPAWGLSSRDVARALVAAVPTR